MQRQHDISNRGFSIILTLNYHERMLSFVISIRKEDNVSAHVAAGVEQDDAVVHNPRRADEALQACVVTSNVNDAVRGHTPLRRHGFRVHCTHTDEQLPQRNEPHTAAGCIMLSQCRQCDVPRDRKLQQVAFRPQRWSTAAANDDIKHMTVHKLVLDRFQKSRMSDGFVVHVDCVAYARYVEQACRDRRIQLGRR